ncbi:MAG TPA: hypothetical protein VJX92_06345 [Methylomirabilota bacterium]|nr:hypothetical protein [Methylomirabilota bacterium]
MTPALALTLVGLAFRGAFASTGQVSLWPAAPVVLGFLGGAPLGGRVSRRVPVTVLRVLASIITVVVLRVWLDVVTR